MTRLALPENPMRKGDVARLLALIASIDQRTVGDADVEAWHLVASAARWQTAYASRAVIDFAQTAERERLMPGHITNRIRFVREHYAGTFRFSGYPPELGNDVHAQVAWEQQQRRAHIVTNMIAWAAGEQTP